MRRLIMIIPLVILIATTNGYASTLLFANLTNSQEVPPTVPTLAQLPNILAGRSYINFHATQFGGGEVRGALVVVPEPSTVVLLGLGIFAILLGLWRGKVTRARPE